MKTGTIKFIILGLFFVFLVACSTKKNNFISRNSHALNTKYNILYNGGIALDKGIVDLKSGYNDDFWEILPIERMQVSKEEILPGQTKNENFDRAETKATKSIQKHSMNIGGREKNPQMDEAHLMLGKARYYDQRFVPALEAFNYVLYKYPESDKIYEVKIWREKTNMRLENDALAVTNLRKLLKDIKFRNQVFADANATLAQAFLNLKEKDSAVAKLKLAREFTRSNEEKARYNFILGQVYEDLGFKDSAFAAYQNVIDMKRKSAKQYVIQSHARQALQFDYEKGDTLAFVEKYNDLLEDRENRPFLDVLNHQMGLFYDKNKKTPNAIKYYNASLKKKTGDQYLIASNYRNLADIYFYKAKYVTAGKYFDSTLTVLKPRTREFKLITKKRENLEDVIKYEAIAQRNDSILKLAAFSPKEREDYFNEFIEKLKIEDEKIKKAQLEIERKAKNELANASSGEKGNEAAPVSGKSSGSSPKNSSSKSGNFYFYNPTTIAYGKIEFVKNWGKRAHGPNWRLVSKESGGNTKDNDSTNIDEDSKNPKQIEPKYTTDFYTKLIPTDQNDLDSIAKERNFAYFQLGVIYKEKFKEYKLAANKLEQLLENAPEERLVLPSLYNLYKIYQIIDSTKADDMRNRIISKFPDSRYAQLLSNNSVSLELGSPEEVFNKLYKDYEKGIYREVLLKTEMAIVEFTAEEILPKYDLLKANLIGKLYGLAEYKKALNFVALTYPNTSEGKETEKFIATKIPLLESYYFNDTPPTSWKILFQPKTLDEKEPKALLEKLNKFVKERSIETLTISTDIYTKERNLIVIHGIKSEESAKGITHVLKEFKEYKIPDVSVVISSEDYKIVQMHKNLDEYIKGDGPNFIPKERPQIEIPKEEVVQQKAKETPKDVPAEILNEIPRNEDNKGGKGSKGKENNPPSDSGNPMNNMLPPAPNNPRKG